MRVKDDPDPILQRLDEILATKFGVLELRDALRALLADVAIECADACIGGDLLTMDYKAEIRARFGVVPKEGT